MFNKLKKTFVGVSEDVCDDTDTADIFAPVTQQHEKDKEKEENLVDPTTGEKDEDPTPEHEELYEKETEEQREEEWNEKGDTWSGDEDEDWDDAPEDDFWDSSRLDDIPIPPPVDEPKKKKKTGGLFSFLRKKKTNTREDLFKDIKKFPKKGNLNHVTTIIRGGLRTIFSGARGTQNNEFWGSGSFGRRYRKGLKWKNLEIIKFLDFMNIPDEVIWYTLTFVDYKDLYYVSYSGSKFAQIIRNEMYWKERFENECLRYVKYVTKKVSKSKDGGGGDEKFKVGTAMFEFEAEDQEELGVKENEEVLIIADQGEWLLCQNMKTKAEGYVPTSYIEVSDKLMALNNFRSCLKDYEKIAVKPNCTWRKRVYFWVENVKIYKIVIPPPPLNIKGFAEEVRLHLLTFLTANDMIKLCSVSKSFFEVFEKFQMKLFAQLVARDFSFLIEQMNDICDTDDEVLERKNAKRYTKKLKKSMQAFKIQYINSTKVSPKLAYIWFVDNKHQISEKLVDEKQVAPLNLPTSTYDANNKYDDFVPPPEEFRDDVDYFDKDMSLTDICDQYKEFTEEKEDDGKPKNYSVY